MKKQIIERYTIAILEDSIIKYIDNDFFDKNKKNFEYYYNPQVYFNNENLKIFINKINKFTRGYNVIIIKQIIEVNINKLYDGEGGLITKVETDVLHITNLDYTKRGYCYIVESNKELFNIINEIVFESIESINN